MLSDETIIKTGRFLGYANMVLGLIGSFMLASKFGITYRTEDVILGSERNVGLTIAIFIGCMFEVCITSFILLGISSVLENQYSKAAGNQQRSTMLSKLADEVSEKERKDAIINSGWRCPNCGRKNASSIKVCLCGQEKFDA
ncbi:MAG: hypothetical protein VZR32_01795 [Candidatus Weimeria sp.]|nr:hypothetical protein [Candidatus Weimeria sp.]